MAATATAEKAKAMTGEKPDYTEDPSGYLLWHNWRPLGVVKSPRTKWIDPTKPWPDGTYSKIPVFSRDQDGNLNRQTHKNEKGQMVNTEQVLWSPPGRAMIMEEAVEVQVEREMREQLAAAREEAKAKKAG